MRKRIANFSIAPERWLHVLFWLACACFTAAVVYLSLEHVAATRPGDSSRTTPIAAAVVLVLAALGAGAVVLGRYRPGTAAPGAALAALFLIAYFSLAVSLGVLPDDNFYDTDPGSWLNRFAAPPGELIDMRPVHPFAFLIFRPLVWLLSLFLGGDRFHAALLLNAGAGALCVLLAWSLARRLLRSEFFALWTAALLGLSTSHLILSASLETYIFSAAILLGFTLLSSREPRALKALIPAGLVTFGITLTNFVQTLFLLAFQEPKPAKLIRYTVSVLAAAAALAFVQARLYPTSQPFYIPDHLLAEDRYSYNLFAEGPAAAFERAHVLGRTISVFSVVAPRPLVFLEETGCEFPCFQTYKHRWDGAVINSYAGLGSLLARTWFVALLAAAGGFVWKLFKARAEVTLQAALAACIFFNFSLHMNYGDDPMLYSGDWTYAVVFFVALALKDRADSLWLQAGALLYLMLLMMNNWRFLHAVMQALYPFFL